MSRVAEVLLDEQGTQGFIVKTNYDGYRVAGPFSEKVDALLAKDRLPSPVVRTARRKEGKGSYFIENEDTGEILLEGERFRSFEAAIKARAKFFPTEKAAEEPKGKRGRTAD